MLLSVRILGLDLFSVEMSTDSPSPEPDDEYDPERELSGGTTGVAGEVYAASTDCYMGFTNGRSE